MFQKKMSAWFRIIRTVIYFYCRQKQNVQALSLLKLLSMDCLLLPIKRGEKSYVEDGVTRRCLPLGSTGADFATAIMDIVENGRLESYSKAARAKYEKELNWDSWLKSFDAILADLRKQ